MFNRNATPNAIPTTPRNPGPLGSTEADSFIRIKDPLTVPVLGSTKTCPGPKRQLYNYVQTPSEIPNSRARCNLQCHSNA